MPATITGIVFNDLNHNGQFNPGEPGIPNVFVVLFSSTGGTCITTQTDANGNYSFSVSVAGSYSIYEPVANPGLTCPPTTFTQPSGFTVSNGARKLNISVTQTQINNNATIANQNFSHDTTNNPLFCTTTLIQFANTPTTWFNINVVTGATVAQGLLNPSIDANAIGYNVLDNYIYGYDQTNNSIIRVDKDGNVSQLSLPQGLPVDGYNVGAFDLNGFLYISVNDIARFFVVDLRPNSATFMKLVNPATGFTEQTSNFGIPLSSTLNVSDWVLRPSDNFLYGVTPTGVVRRISPSTGTTTNLTTTPLNTGPFGAIAMDASGNIYAISNQTGTIFRYTIVGNNATAVPFSTTVTTSNNDATMCLLATVNVDFGDAPDTSPGNGPNDYSTLLANNGPRHEIINELFLGTVVTAEPDALQNATATGDDIPKGIQDDGLTVPLPTLSISATSSVLQVTVTNNTGSPANLYGWVDFNENGIFQGNEAAPVQVVPSQPGTQIVPLTFTVPVGVTLTPSQTFVRLRLTTDTLINQNAATPTAVDTRSLGPASDGEVEDYILSVNNIADLQVVKTNSPVPVFAGNPLDYNIVVTNNGPDAALNVDLSDPIPPEILNPQFSLNGGVTFQPWTGNLSLGTVPPGVSIPILIRGTVSPTANGTIMNTATVKSTTEDPNLDNNTSTSFAPVSQSADVSVVKTASPSPATAGELLTYTIVVSNAGPSVAQDVELIDAVPSELTNVEFSIDGGVTFIPWPGSTVIGTLANGASVTILIRGLVSPSVTGTIINTAVVTSSTPDPDPTNNTSTTNTPVNASADISVVKVASPSPVLTGQLLTYDLVVSNAGPSDAENVILTDAIPATLTNVEFSTDGGATFNPWPGSTNIGTLANGMSVTIIIRGIVSSSAIGSITNTATVTSTTPDPDPTNNTSTVITPVTVLADLSIVKTDSPSPVIPGNVLTYTLVVANAGPSDAANVTVTDAVPSVLLNPEFSTNGGVTFNPWPGSTNIGTLANGATVTILIRGTVNPSATGSISNTATVSSTTPDPDPTNNTSTTVTPISVQADISVVKTASPSPVNPGQLLTYTILVSNAGPSDAEDVLLTDAVPSELLGAEFSLNGGVTFNPWPGSINLGTIANGASVTILIRGTVSPSTTGSITNTATVHSTTPDPDPTNNTSTITTPVNESADISVVKLGNPDPIIAGEVLTYTIVISNAGPSDAANVTLTDAVPSALLNPEFSTNGGVTFNPWPGSINLGPLVNGDTITVLLRGTVSSSATGNISNTATVSSTTPDPDPTNNTSTFVTPIETSADLSVVKTGSPSPVPAGGLLTYTVVISNAGPSDAQNVTLTDAVPSDLTGVEFSTDGGVIFNPWPGSVNIGTLANGASQTILIRGTVNPLATDVITNTAVVSSTTPDPDPTNNTSTEITPINTSADISVVKTASPSPVLAGSVLTYTIVISNAGPNIAQNVTLTDTIPLEITSPEFSTDGGVTFNPWPGSLNIGTLLNGATQTVLIRGTVNPLATGSITNTATVDSTTPDPDPDNNTSTTVTPINTSADVSIVKTASPNPAIPGELLTYTLVVSNAGPNDALNVVVTDPIPGELSNPEFSIDGGVTFHPWTGSLNVGTVANGATVTILIRGTVDSSTTESITNTATVSSTTPDPDPENNTSTIVTPVNPSADISIVKTASPSPVNPGELLTYILVVSNAGPSDAQDVTVIDAAPSELSNVEFSTDGGITFNPWPGSINIGTVTNGASEVIIIRGLVSPSATGTITNTATVNSPTPDPDPTNNTSTVDTPVTDFADVSIVKIGSPDPVIAGELLTYTLLVSNAGPADAQNVVVSDAVPSQLTNVQFSINGGVTFNPWPGSLNIGTLANGNSVTIILRGTVSSSATGTIINTATVNSTTTDPNPNNNTSTDTTPVITSANLSIVKTGNPSPVNAGELLTYTLLVSNAGPSDALNVTVTDAVPGSLSNVQFSLDGGVTFNPWPGSIGIGTLANGASRTILIRGMVGASVTGSITNTATVTSTTPDPDPTDNTSTEITPVTQFADLSIVKTASPSPVNAGELLTYTLLISNAGPSDAQNVSLIDAVPAELTNAEFSTDGGSTFTPWISPQNLGTIPSGSTVTVLIRGLASPSVTGIITNTASVFSPTPDPDPTNNTSTIDTPVTSSADISIVKTASPIPVIPGNLLTYTLVVSNAGPSDAQNITITDVVPGVLTNVQFSLDGGVTFNPWPGSIHIGTLANGDVETIIIRGTVSASAVGTITNTASASSTTPDPDPDNNTSTIVTPVSPTADLSIVKTASPTPAIPGQLLTYTLLVSNAGPADAQNVVVTDTVPAQLLNPQFSINGGITFNPWPGFVNLGTLANGASVTILIRGTVSLSATGSITNTATVSSTTPDPDPENNTSTIVTPVGPAADVSIEKITSPCRVRPGAQLLYMLVISNAGPAAAENVVVTDTIPSQLLNPEFSLDGVTFIPWPSSLNLGTLAIGASETIFIRGTVSSSAAGSIINTATVSSTTPDPNPANNTSTVVIQVCAFADLSVTKIPSSTQVFPGQVLTYTIVVSNLGPAAADNVVLIDAVPSQLLNPQFSTDGGITFNPWLTSTSLGALASGDSVTVLIRGTVSPTAVGVLTNTASVGTATRDPNPCNNRTTIVTPILPLL